MKDKWYYIKKVNKGLNACNENSLMHEMLSMFKKDSVLDITTEEAKAFYNLRKQVVQTEVMNFIDSTFYKLTSYSCDAIEPRQDFWFCKIIKDRFRGKMYFDKANECFVVKIFGEYYTPYGIETKAVEVDNLVPEKEFSQDVNIINKYIM